MLYCLGLLLLMLLLFMLFFMMLCELWLVLFVLSELGFILLLEFEIVMILGEEGEFGIFIGEEVCFVGVFDDLFFWWINFRGFDIWFIFLNKYVFLLYFFFFGDDIVCFKGVCLLDSFIGMWVLGVFWKVLVDSC